MGLLNKFKNFSIAAGNIIAPLGQSIGAALAVPEAKRLEQERIDRGMQLQQQIMDSALKFPKGSEERKRRLKLASNVFKDQKGIIDSVQAFQEKPLQTFAKGAITAGNILLLGKMPESLQALRAKPVVDFIAGAGGVQKLSTAAKIARGARIVATDFGIGAGFGTLFALERGETKPKEIVKEASMVGATSAVLPPVIGKTFGITGKLISKGAKGIGAGLEKGIVALEKIAENPVAKPQNQLDEFVNIAFGEKQAPLFKNVAGKLAGTGRQLQDLPSRLKTALLDRMNPIRNLSKQVSEITGKSVSFVDDPYQQARRTQGIVDGKFGQEASLLFKNLINDFSDVELEAQGYLAAKNALDRLNLGQKVVRGKTLDEVTDAIRIAEESPAFSIIKQYESGIQKVRDRLLQIRQESGLLSKEQVETFQKTHPNYLPNKVLDFFEEGGSDFNSLIKPGASKFSVTESGVKRAKGSERELLNPIESLLVDLKKAINDSERNKVANMIVNLGKDVKDLGFRKLAPEDKALKSIDIAKQGLEKISRFVDGIKEDWLVPRDLGAAMKNLEVPELGVIGKILSIPTQILKAGATRFNPDFIFRNPARDIQTANIVSETGLSGIDWAKILLQGKNKSRELLNLAESEGALLSGLLQKAKTPKSIIKALDETPTIKKIAGEYNPFSIIEKIGAKLENTTRLAVFKGSLKQGLSPAEAAFNARNASIDFSKMGNVTAVINKIIPFLNARIQGFTNIGTAIAKDPTKFVRQQFWTAVYPAMLLNSHNNQFESYKNIDQETKDQNWVIMVGEEDGVDDGGYPIKIPNAIRIPKGEAQQAVANTITNFLDFAKGKDHRTWQELTKDLATGISPIGGVSSLGPLTIPLELATNFDLFREKAIVPDFISIGGKAFDSKDLENKYQYTSYSSETAKKIGQWFDISPAKVDFINGKLFGGTGTTIFKSLDLVDSGFKEPVNVSTDDDLSTFQKFSQLPVFKGFLTTAAYGGYLKDLELADKVSKELANPEFIERQKAELIWKTLKQLPPEEANAQAKQIKEEDKKMFSRLRDIKTDEKDGLNSTERIIKNLQVENGERALYIVEQLNLIDDREGKNNLYKMWLSKKLITDKVKKQLLFFKENGRLESPED